MFTDARITLDQPHLADKTLKSRICCFDVLSVFFCYDQHFNLNVTQMLMWGKSLNGWFASFFVQCPIREVRYQNYLTQRLKELDLESYCTWSHEYELGGVTCPVVFFKKKEYIK